MEMAEDRRHSHVCSDSRMAISARGRACSLRLLTLLGPRIQDALKQPPHTPRYTSCLTVKPMGTVQKQGFQANPPGATGSRHPGLLSGHACLSLWSLCITQGPAHVCRIWGKTGGDVTPVTFLSSQVRGPKPWSRRIWVEQGVHGC